jgi:hypothetical protein
MSPSIPPDILRGLTEFRLFDALFGRRTRRFGLGFEISQGPYRYESAKAPSPLCESEEALLVAAGVGFTGLALWDQSRPLPYRSGDGRTFPSTSRGRRTALFFTNDHGVHAIDPSAGSAQDIKEPGLPDGDRMLDLHRQHRLTLQPSRLDVPRRTPPLCGHNLWASNMPGSTLFMPICDVTHALIGLIAQFVDPQLERFAATKGRGLNIVDDRFGFRPAGTEAWLKSGFLAEDNPLPLSHLEREACYFMFSEPAAICQNMFLATEAMGLGGWMHCGFLSQEIFEALGFTVVEPPGALPNPVGLDPVFHAYCPPFFETMDAAVDAVLEPLLRDASVSRAATHRPAPYLMGDAEHRAATVAVSEEGIACTKAVCNYIYQTYGRFPATVDALHLMWMMQVHHLDTEFYDRFYRPGAYGPTHRAHMASWHPDFAPRTP